MARKLRKALITVSPEIRGLPANYRLTHPLKGNTRQEQLEDIVHLAYHVHDGMSFLFDADGCSGMSQAFARMFSLIFRFEGFTDDEVHSRLQSEVRRKYQE